MYKATNQSPLNEHKDPNSPFSLFGEVILSTNKKIWLIGLLMTLERLYMNVGEPEYSFSPSRYIKTAFTFTCVINCKFNF